MLWMLFSKVFWAYTVKRDCVKILMQFCKTRSHRSKNDKNILCVSPIGGGLKSMFVKRRQSLANFGGFSRWLLPTAILLSVAGTTEAAVRHVNPNRLGCPTTNNTGYVDIGMPGANGVVVYCTIAGAIDNSGFADIIYIAPHPKSSIPGSDTYHESLVLNNPASRSLTIIGSGISQTIIDSSSRAFLIREDVTIKHLTMDVLGPPKSGTGGAINMAGNIVVNVEDAVIKNADAGLGGGIAVESGTLNLLRVALIDNTAKVDYEDFSIRPLPAGGGIYIGAAGTLTAIDSVISGNAALQVDTAGVGGFGAGIYNLGTTTLINTTVSGNTAFATDIAGGGITNGDSTHSAELNLYNVTVANNTASLNGGGIYNFNGTVNVKSSIIASNTDNGAAPNCGANSNSGFNSLDYNIIGCDAAVFPAAANDIEVLSATLLNLLPLPTYDPTLEFYGMPVFWFHGLDIGSVAIDNVGVNSCLDHNSNPLANDQRGVRRPFDGDSNGENVCDTGAYEVAEDIIVYPTELLTFEDQNTTQFYIALARPPAPSQTVQLNISSEMTSEGIVTTPTISFDDTDWNTPKAVQINVQNDGLEDGDQTYAVNVSTSDINVATKPVTITNIDTVVPPDLIVEPASVNITEGGLPATLKIKLTTPPAAGSVVHVLIANDREIGLVRQETISPSDLNFDDSTWRTFQDVIVSAVDDSDPEISISYNLIVSVQDDSTDNVYLGKTITIPITVNDNDQSTGTPGITFGDAANLTTTEDGGQATFTAVLDSPPTADVTINFVSNDINEGQLLVGQNLQQTFSLTFSPQNWNQPQTVIVQGVDDIYADGGKIYHLVTQVDSNDDTYNGLDPGDIQIINNDNETPGIVVTPASGLVTDESGTSVTFQVQLSIPPAPTTEQTQPIFVALTATVQPPGSGLPLEGAITSPASPLVFNAANYDQPQTVTVQGLDDCVADGDRNYTITISTDTSTTSAPYKFFNPTQTVAATNTDNDNTGSTTQIVISKSQLITSENGTADSFDVCLSAQPSATVTINMTIPNSFAGEGIFSNGLTSQDVVFNQSNWSTLQMVEVTGLDDTLDDGDQTYQIHVEPAVSADPDYANFAVPDISVTNVDNDNTVPGPAPSPTPSGIIVTNAETPPITSEGGDQSTFTITLASQPSHTVIVKVIVGDTTEGQIVVPPPQPLFEKKLTFFTTTWDLPQSITIVGLDDQEIDGNIDYDIILDTSESTAIEYKNMNVPPIKITNLDNDKVDPIDATAGGGHINPGMLGLLFFIVLVRWRRWNVLAAIDL